MALQRRERSAERTDVVRALAIVTLLLVMGSGCEPATLSEIQSDILTPTCAAEGCHGDFLAARDLDLSEGVSHGALVNVAAQEPGYVLVVPGDPEESLLYQVLLSDIYSDGDDQPVTLDRMPPRVGDVSGLSQQQLAAVRSWIADGAQDN